MLSCIAQFRRGLLSTTRGGDDDSASFENALSSTLELVARIAEFFRLYGSYVKSYAGVNELFRVIVLRWDNEEFADFLEKQCQGSLSLEALLIQPIQRLAKYELFFSDLEKRLDDAVYGELRRKVLRTLLRIRKSVKAVEALAQRLEAQDVVYDYFTQLDHPNSCVEDMIQPHVYFLDEFPDDHGVAYRVEPKKKVKERRCEVLLFTDFCLVLVAATSFKSIFGFTKKKYAKFRLQLSECIFVGQRDTGIWVLRDSAAPTSDSLMVHVHSPPTKLDTNAYIKLTAPDRASRDALLTALNDQKLDLRDRRDSFCTTPGSARSSSLFLHSPRRLPSTPTELPATSSRWGVGPKKQRSSSLPPVPTAARSGPLTTIDETVSENITPPNVVGGATSS
mmetsp:Transcript_17861/g.54628  ORF Transcript_17861/g.54628 Transcript_17861/m.54628 type:complete len:393 (+) Transcript_17861:1137-2315(+)